MLDDLYILTASDGFTSICDASRKGLQHELDRRVWAYPVHATHWSRHAARKGPEGLGGWWAVEDWIISWP